MTLEEQLNELRDQMLRDYSTLVSGDYDRLWSDEVLLSYIKDGERRFARRTLILRDKSTELVTQVELVAGQSDYLLHPSVIAVVSARYDADSFDLHRIGRTLVSETRPVDNLYFDPSNVTGLAPGRPMAVATDEALVYDDGTHITLTVYPTPTAAEAGKLIQLRVARMPIREYSFATLQQESELPEDYQLDALNWAAYRALRNQDADAGSPLNAETFKQRFDATVKEAVDEAKRKMFAPATFRFGGNGFSWSR